MVGDGERKLQRAADRLIGGVCGGLAAYFGASPTVVRVGWVALTVLSLLLPGLLVYLIFWAALPAAAPRLSGLLGELLPDEALAGSVARVRSVVPPPGAPAGPAVLLSGLHGGAAPLLLAAWWRSAPRAALLVAPTRELAQGLADDLEEWLGPEAVVYLPQQEVLAFDRQSPDPDGVGLFLDGLDRLARGPARLAVTSLYGVRQRVMSPASLAAAAIELAVGERHDRDDLCARLAARGYRSAGLVARPGDLARRGGLIDLYAPGGRPLRLEFFDDEIVSLRTFDVESQRSVDRFETVRILPVSHLVLDDDARLSALARAESAALAAGLDAGERADLEAHLEDRGHGEGLEAFLPWFGPTALLTDHLSPGAPVFWLDPVSLGAQSELLDAELPRSREVRLRRDPALPEPGELVAPPAALADAARPHVLVAGAWITGDTSGHWLHGAPAAEVRFATARPDLRGGDVQRLHADVARREAAGERVLMLCDNAGQAERLGELLDETDGGSLASRPAVGAVSGGFLWPEAGLACFTDHEFFERYQRPARARRQAAGVVRDARALQGGQFVVHIDYGIGVYRGLRRITADGAERECLLIEYAEGDKVYVPVDKIEQVERFTSDSEARPDLSKLGATQWTRVTKRARKAIRAMAAELIELYASRQALEGHAFPPDDPLQRALEDSFLYDETPDQLTAIDDVKRDMESARPMDRLVCGDVGYGKTEVAMRAAFKAVMAGRQVAVLCPTTLLVRQHGDTFAERFRDFPVRVETLSRFRSPREAKAVAEAAREGRVDILIGTHRLLSRDVRFRNLGLLVIDEEHRFGVRHKERLKELRRLVDVMTLSATPIPRTLYLALMGARDMSVINTPPRDRLPIHTELCQFSEETLAEAILRELHRGGQVFFVHNRIETIEATAARVRDIVPGVRLGIAHGQLPEDRLDRVMTAFLAHEFDVLVTTAIIESGLDMPRVNTIVIDRADRLGLAQLYQLRGRVGRSSQRAYAYLMTPPGEALTPEARRRLAALEEFQALGSGYHIAMRDLEIRGAGNLLGEEQHGHMEAIGFDLYCRLLEETVLELKGGGGAVALEVKVDLRLAAYLPDDWIGDPEQKMDLYRRLARLREGRDFARLREELRDRYGPLPGEVENLLGVQRVRVLAAVCGVEEVRAERGGIALFFAGGREPSPTIIRGLMGTGPKGLMFKAADQFVMKVPAAREQVLAAAHAVLDLLDRLHRAEPGGDALRALGRDPDRQGETMNVCRMNPQAGRPALAVRLTLFALVALLALAWGGCSRSPEKNVIATVGPKSVTQAEYELNLAKLQEIDLPRDAQGRIVDTATSEGRHAFLNVIINKDLMALKAEDLGLGADQQIVQSTKAMRESMAMKVMKTDLIEKPGGQISDAEIAEYYGNLQTKRKCSYIICNFIEDAAKARQEIVAGKPWEDVADEYNDGSRGPADDCTIELQWGRLDDSFELAVWSLKQGEISQPFLSVYGYWLVRVDRLEPVRVQPLDGEYRQKVLGSIRKRKMNLAQRTFFEESRRKHDFKLDETGLWIVFQGLPEGEILIDPATDKPTPREQLKPLNIPLGDYDKFLYQVRREDKLETWTVGDYKQFYDKLNVFERPKRTDLLGLVRGNLIQVVDEQLLTEEARERGFLDDPRVDAYVNEKRERMLVTRLHDQVVPTDMPVAPEELASYWRDNRAQLDLPEQRYGKIILCASEPIAQQVRIEAAAGKPWDELLNRWSSDQTNKQNRGNYGPVFANAEGSHVKPIFSVARGDLSAVFKFNQSWAFARVDSIVAPRAREFDEVAGEVGEILNRRHQEEKLLQLLAEWRQQFPVKIHARRLDKARSWAQLTTLPPPENPTDKPAVK